MPTAYTRTIERAIQVAGDAHKLARFLGCPEATLREWACGAANPPPEIFLALVDIVAANHLAPAALANLRR